MIYKNFIRPLLFKFDSESIHDFVTNFGNKLSNHGLAKNLIKKFYCYESEKLNLKLFNMNFKNPIGLAAGFDKNALLTDLIPYFGFGFMEVGSITAKYCPGNLKPRLVRLPKDNALIVNYGLYNYGAKKIYNHLRNKEFLIPTGISIAKTNLPGIFDNKAIDDYCESFRLFKNSGNYITLNISCPNAEAGTTFCQDTDALEKLLKKIRRIKPSKPIFLKISPDVNTEQLNKIIKLSKKYGIKSLIISNLSKDRNKLKLKTDKKILSEYGEGGISGLPIKEISNNLIKKTYDLSKEKICIIGCGGIFNANDAYEKLKIGSSLLQLITGMIYKGPSVIKEINQGLVKLIEKDKFKNIKEVIGYRN